jgi:antitoxin ParD1/3/4
MVIALPPELEILVQSQVENGNYENAIDALFAGMNLLVQQQEFVGDEISQSELRREVMIGWEASQRGEVVDGPTAMNQILEDLRSRYGAGQA